MAARLTERPGASGIRLQVRDLGVTVEVEISAENLPDATAEKVTAKLSEQIGQDPSVAIRAAPGALMLVFAVVDSRSAD